MLLNSIKEEKSDVSIENIGVMPAANQELSFSVLRRNTSSFLQQHQHQDATPPDLTSAPTDAPPVFTSSTTRLHSVHKPTPPPPQSSSTSSNINKLLNLQLQHQAPTPGSTRSNSWLFHHQASSPPALLCISQHFQHQSLSSTSTTRLHQLHCPQVHQPALSPPSYSTSSTTRLH